MTLSGATSLVQSRPGINGNEGVLCMPQISSPSDCLMSLSGHFRGVGFTPQWKCSQCISPPHSTGLMTFKYSR